MQDRCDLPAQATGRRKSWLLWCGAGLLVAALPLFGLTPAAEAQAPDIRDLRPLMLMLMDTSGSMERLPNCTCTTASCTECNPDCSTGERNRWSMVVESMTGTFPTFSCTQQDRSTGGFVGEPDYQYVIPHHDITATGQNTDGILDAYRERVRFGLMTFDGIGTLRTAGVLVPEYDWDAPFQLDSQTSEGQYSYGGTRQLFFPGCSTTMAVDNGMRSDFPEGGTGAGQQPGNMVSVGDPADYVLVNQRIQDSLLEIRPFGPTPVAALLEDLQFYIANHPDVRPVSGGVGDPFADCRTRYAVLVTDGQPNADFRDLDIFTGDTCEAGPPYICPYDTPETTTTLLCDMDASGECTGDIDGLFVIGFNVTGDPATVARLNGLADLGGTGDIVRTITGTSNGALFANDITSLREAMSAVLDASAGGTTTRTNPSFAAAGSTGSAQRQFNTGFQQGIAAGDPWEGILERRRFECDGSLNVVEAPIDDSDRFHEKIAQQGLAGTRKVYTVIPSVANAGGWIVGSGRSEMQSAGLPTIGTGAGTPAETGLTTVDFSTSITAGHLGVTTSAEVSDIVNHIEGTGGRALSAIYHSSPVAVSAPDIDRPDESFNLYRNLTAVADRPTVLYFGTNDGVLHAVATEDNIAQGISAGDELFAFVPPALFSKLDAARTAHQPMLDATPVVREVFTARLPGALPDADQYRTVLVVGLRGGGNAYFALDVTNPIDAMTNGPKFLWQFSDPDMGDTYGTPAIAQVLNNVSGSNERAAAILPGGTGIPLGGTCVAPPGVTTGLTGVRTQRRCWDTRGRALWVLDLYSGDLIREFDSTDGISSPLTGSVVSYSGEVGVTASRAFMSDQDGMIWRLDMTSANPVDWDITPFHDVFYNEAPDFGEPAYNPPVLSTDATGNVVLLQATGDVDVLDGTTANRVVSLTEAINFDSTGSFDPATDVTATLNFEEVLRAGEQVTGPLALFGGVVYFGTFYSSASASNACNFGESRVMGMGYIDQAPAFEIAPGVMSEVGETFDNQIVFGVSVTQDTNCFTETTEFDPYLGQNIFKLTGQGGGGYKLRFQVSGGGSSAVGGSVNEGSIELPQPQFFTEIESRASSID